MKLAPRCALLLGLALPVRGQTPPDWGGGLQAFPRFTPSPAARPAPAPAASGGLSLIVTPDARTRADLDRVIARMLRSPLARELAAELAAHGRPVFVAFDRRLDSRLLEDGRADGHLGVTDSHEGRVRVRLTPRLLSPGNEDQAAGVLAHELLGHANRRLRAGEDASLPGVARQAEDESLARLIEGIVLLELGAEADEAELRALAADPSEEQERRSVSLSGYLLKLSAAQMRDPLAAYRARSGRVEAERRELASLRRAFVFQRAAIDHFVREHGDDPAAFARQRAELEAQAGGLDEQERRLTRDRGVLAGVISLAESGSLEPPLESIAADADHPVVHETLARLERMRARALAMLDARPPRPARPAAAASSPTHELLARIREDADVHPEFWRAAAAELRGAD